MKLHTVFLTMMLGAAPATATLMACGSDSDEASEDGDQKSDASGPSVGGDPTTIITAQFDAMTEIMEKHEDKPEEGVEKLRSHLQDNLPEIFYALGKIVAEADKIEDPDDRRKYLQETGEELGKAGEKFGEAAEKFGEKADGNEDVKEYLEKWGESWVETGGNEFKMLEMMMQNL